MFDFLENINIDKIMSGVQNIFKNFMAPAPVIPASDELYPNYPTDEYSATLSQVYDAPSNLIKEQEFKTNWSAKTLSEKIKYIEERDIQIKNMLLMEQQILNINEAELADAAELKAVKEEKERIQLLRKVRAVEKDGFVKKAKEARTQAKTANSFQNLFSFIGKLFQGFFGLAKLFKPEKKAYEALSDEELNNDENAINASEIIAKLPPKNAATLQNELKNLMHEDKILNAVDEATLSVDALADHMVRQVNLDDRKKIFAAKVRKLLLKNNLNAEADEFKLSNTEKTLGEIKASAKQEAENAKQEIESVNQDIIKLKKTDPALLASELKLQWQEDFKKYRQLNDEITVVQYQYDELFEKAQNSPRPAANAPYPPHLKALHAEGNKCYEELCELERKKLAMQASFEKKRLDYFKLISVDAMQDRPAKVINRIDNLEYYAPPVLKEYAPVYPANILQQHENIELHDKAAAILMAFNANQTKTKVVHGIEIMEATKEMLPALNLYRSSMDSNVRVTEKAKIDNLYHRLSAHGAL